MSSAALTQANLSSSFWRYAIQYSVYIKNRLPHVSLENETPLQVHKKQLPQYQDIKMFGSLCYQLTPLTARRDKFKPITSPRVFLGFDPHSSYNTALLFNSITRRISYRHTQDVVYNVELSYQEFRRRERERTPL